MQRVRFLSRVALAGGPMYNAGEETNLADETAEGLLGRGLAERVPPVESPKPRAVEAPPVDRMLRRGGGERVKYREG